MKTGDTFDNLVRNGRLTDAVRFFAKEYYDNGKMGYTRKTILEQLADKLDNYEEKRAREVEDESI